MESGGRGAVRIIPERYPDANPMSSGKSDNHPVGIISYLAHNREMDFDPTQRREALKKFIRIEKLKVSPWEKEADIGDGALRKFLAGNSNSLSDKTYQALAMAASHRLGRPVPLTELRGEITEPAGKLPLKSEIRNIDDNLQLPHYSEMTRDVPVFGAGSGEAGGLQMGDDQALDQVRRPPRYNERRGTSKDIFAVHVEGISMAPRHRPGELLYIDPLRHADIGDDVIVEIRGDTDGVITTVLRALAGREGDEITLAQLTPPGRIVVKLDRVVHMYRVMTTHDLLGN
jgi:phage repressor protein C with HTH and peptisase S24 domain